MPPTITFTGDKELQRKLRSLEVKASKKAARAGVNAGLNPIMRAIKVGVNSTQASAKAKLAARQTVGKKLATSKGVVTTAKVGFGTGTRGQRRRSEQKAKARSSGGVGISSRNIHWSVLGTKNRVQKKTGRKTGSTQPLFAGVVARAVASTVTAVVQAARKKAWEVIRREARRKR